MLVGSAIVSSTISTEHLVPATSQLLTTSGFCWDFFWVRRRYVAAYKSTNMRLIAQLSSRGAEEASLHRNRNSWQRVRLCSNTSGIMETYVSIGAWRVQIEFALLSDGWREDKDVWK